MTAAGFGAADRVKIAGDSMTGTLNLGGNPPLTVPGPVTSGYVLTTDGTGAINLAPATGGSGTALTPVSKTGTYTANAGEFVICNATSASFTVTLPNGPADKAIVAVKMTVTASSHTVSIAPNGAGSDVINVAGNTTPLVLSLPNQGVLLQYSTSGTVWYVYGDDLPLGQLDSRYLAQAGGTVSGNLAVTGTATVGAFKMTAGATNTYVLTSDGSGNGSWAVAPGAGGGMANPMTTLGDIIYENATPAAARLAADTSNTRKFLRTQSVAGTGQAPAWDTLTNGDLPSGAALLAGAAFTGNISTTGTLAVTGNTTASGTLAVSKRVTSGFVNLTDASTISVDASLGNIQRVTINGNRTMGTPSNPADGQGILFEITQGLSAPFTITWSSAYAAGTTVAFPTLTTTAGKMDKVGFRYNATAAKWHLEAFALGF